MTVWRRTRLKHLASLRAGTWGEEPGVADRAVYCVRAADFDRTRLRVSADRLPVRSVDPSTFRELALRHGDIVLEKSGGGSDQPVGGSALFDLGVDAVCSNFAARLRPIPSVEPRFLNYLMASMYFSGVTDALAKQTTGIANLDLGAYVATDCAVPDAHAQAAIADYLDAETDRIDRIMSARAHQLTLIRERLEVQAETLLRVTQAPPIALKRVVDLLPGFSYRSGDFLAEPAQARLLRGINVDVGTLRWDDTIWINDRLAATTSRFALDVGDIVMGMDRPVISSGVRLAQVTEADLPANLVQRVARLRARPGLFQGYLYAALRGPRLADHFAPLFTGADLR